MSILEYLVLFVVWAQGGQKSEAYLTVPLLSPLSQPSRSAQIHDTARYYPFSSYFVNDYDYADAQSYGTNLFYNLLNHMNNIKRQQYMCKNIPVPKTVLNKKYFNPAYELLTYKYWYPPKDHQYVIVWSQFEAYRNSLFLSYMLQGNNANFPPGWLYMYLSAAAQLHSLQTIGFNSQRKVKAIKIPFESNEVFKVNWWDNGNYQKFDKPFAIYATQSKDTDSRYVRVVDFGTGDYSHDYTGHAFIPNYLYDRQRFLFNQTYEASLFPWYRTPYSQQPLYPPAIIRPPLGPHHGPGPHPPPNPPPPFPPNNYNLQLSADYNSVKLVRPGQVDPIYQQNKQQLEQYYTQLLANNQKRQDTNATPNDNKDKDTNEVKISLDEAITNQKFANLYGNVDNSQKNQAEAGAPKQQGYPRLISPNLKQNETDNRVNTTSNQQENRQARSGDRLDYPNHIDKAFELYNFQRDRFKEANIDLSQYSMNELLQSQKTSQYQYFLNQYQQPNLNDPNLVPQPVNPYPNQANLNPNFQPPIQVPNQPQPPHPHHPPHNRPPILPPYYNYIPDMTLMNSQTNKHSSLSQFSPFLFINKNTIPIKDWDPLLDWQRANMSRVSDRNTPQHEFDRWYVKAIEGNIDLDSWKTANENPLNYDNATWIDTYRYANVWWNNETAFLNNKQEYVFRVKPDEYFIKFTGAKHDEGISWTPPYFWCPDPSNWLVTVKSPIWATNDFVYKNKIFYSREALRFVGLSEVVLNYEELDVNQCPGDRELNAFASTALCDSTTHCLALPNYGLQSGGYQCECLSEYHYPYQFQGPYMGKRIDYNPNIYPLCLKSNGLIQFPNWVSKNAVDFILPPNLPSGTVTAGSPPLDRLLKRRRKRDLKAKKEEVDDDEAWLEAIREHHEKLKPVKLDLTGKKKRTKRFIDKRNNFEKLRDSIYDNQDDLQRRCAMEPFRDTLYLNEDDERFYLNLRYHANEVFKPQMAQAIRIAHLLSSYIQLFSPFSSSSIYSQNPFGTSNNFNTNLKTDPQLEEYVLIGEAISTLMSNYPLQEVNIFFNGTEYDLQKFYSTQINLGMGFSAIRSDIEFILNKTTDGTHLSKTWYKDASRRFLYGGGKSLFGGPYEYDDERKFYQNAGPFDANTFKNSFAFDRFGIEMSLRREFQGQSGNVEIPPKYYDAAVSGVWFGPYYDCQKRYMKTRTTLRMAYSVPIITSMDKAYPIGFTNIVIGSDLKWWRINPCDTSGWRNMFQGLHRCDRETTVCEYQDVPEFENGYYLASYKCICRANHEFPFMDYGSSYFEGATIEKEYEKMIKGMPNIYDRLKCRPIMPKQTVRSTGSFYMKGSAAGREHGVSSTPIILSGLVSSLFLTTLLNTV